MKRHTFARTARTFGAGALCGALLGAVATSVVLTRDGDVVRWPAASREGSIVDADAAVIEGAAVGTSGAPSPLPDRPPVLSAPPPAELASRDLALPVQGVSPGELVGSFDDDRGSRKHEAIDILAPMGTPVVAVEDGRIARLFVSKAGGITIYQFDPSERFCYYYAHLQRYADGLREQQIVRKGQIIGYVGVTGNAPKDVPHLHFAIFRLTAEKRWWEGTPVDPYEVLK